MGVNLSLDSRNGSGPRRPDIAFPASDLRLPIFKHLVAGDLIGAAIAGCVNFWRFSAETQEPLMIMPGETSAICNQQWSIRSRKGAVTSTQIDTPT